MSLHNLKKTFAAHCVHKLISQILGMAGSAITTSFIKKPTKNWMIFYLILLLLLYVLLHKYFYYTTKYYYNPPPEQLPFWVTFRKKICFFKEKKWEYHGVVCHKLCHKNRMLVFLPCYIKYYTTPLLSTILLIIMIYTTTYDPYPPKKKCKVILLPWQKKYPLIRQ